MRNTVPAYALIVSGSITHLITIDSLTYTYPPIRVGDPRIVALESVSLYAAAGECIAVTGTNGSGKSTLCAAAAGLAPDLTGGRIDAGRIVIDGRDMQSEKAGALADVIGFVMQDPSGQLFNPTIADEIAWGLGSLGIPPAEMDTRISEALALVGLSDLAWDRDPRTLSGGEQKRLALACALALRPKVLILDEPFGGLSPDGRQEMIMMLRRLREEQSLTILLAESDAAVIEALADRVVELPSSTPMPPAVEDIQHQPKLAPIDAPAIELQNVSFAYDPARPVLRDIDLRIEQGEFVALLGDNGAGKTTLVRHLIGLLKPSSGSVRLMGRDTASMSIGQMAHEVGFAFQNPETQIFNPTIREEIAFGARNLGMSAAENDTAVSAAMAQFGLTEIAEQPPAALSFSVRRRVALASIAAMNTPILVLDEPTVGLDAAGRALVIGWLHQAQAAGVTILLITHDMDLASHAGRTIRMVDGRVYDQAAVIPPHQPDSQVIVPDQEPVALARLDPRVKLWYMVLGIALIFIARDIPSLAAILITAHLALIAVGASIRQIGRAWLTLLPLLAIILVLQPLMHPTGELLWQVGPLSITRDGLLLAIRYALRLSSAAFVVMLPILTTPMPLLVRALVKLGMPYNLGMTIGLALHYLETIGSLYQQISDAQQARGWDLSQGGLWKRVQAAVPTLIAVIIASLRLSDSLALGLAARGFSLDRPRTIRNDIHMTGIDWAVIVGLTLAFAAALMAFLS